MRIPITASPGLKTNPDGTIDYDTRIARLAIGETTIREVPIHETSRAGHGDDPAFFDSEEERIVAEAIATWFANVAAVVEPAATQAARRDFIAAMDVPIEWAASRQSIAYRTAVVVAAYTRQPFPPSTIRTADAETFVREHHVAALSATDCAAFPHDMKTTLERFMLVDDFRRIILGEQRPAFT